MGMSFVDVDQMHEGRPLLQGSHGLFGTPLLKRSYHLIVGCWIWMGYFTVCLRALSIVGFRPFCKLFICLGSKGQPDELKVLVDAALALLFIEFPFLFLRWIAWYHYGVPVSFMGVKNVFGIFEDLYILGIIGGFT